MNTKTARLIWKASRLGEFAMHEVTLRDHKWAWNRIPWNKRHAMRLEMRDLITRYQ